MADLQTLLNKFLASLYGGFGTGVSYLPRGVINSQFAAVSNGTTVETDLLTYTLPANALSANGMGVRVSAWGTGAANGNTKTLRLYFGATVTTNLVTTGSGISWKSVATIVRVSATAQTSEGLTYQTALSLAGVTTGAPGETLSGAVVIKITGQSGTGSGDLTSAGFMVEALP